QYSSSKAEAVCFASGLRSVAFGAGVIHAYLAADRQPPKVVAGISIGAVSAAAMQRCYRELNDAKLGKSDVPVEVARWKWYRTYLEFLLSEPLSAIWDCLPNPTDFLADLPPVVDPGLPVDPKDEETSRQWRQREIDSRRALFFCVT